MSAVKDELLALQAADGKVYPEDVVVWASKHKSSALYRQLTWDDAAAAHQHRIWQVRQLIAVYVVDASGGREMISLTVDRSGDGGYRSINDVLSVDELRDMMLADALAELDRVQAKYQRLKELAEVWAATSKVAARTKRPRPRKAA